VLNVTLFLMVRYNAERATLFMVIKMGKPKGLMVKRSMANYQPLTNFEYSKQKDKDKKAWQDISDSLPDNAFADDVVPDDNETYGKVDKKPFHLETEISHYDG
jgi:hypothetical protein